MVPAVMVLVRVLCWLDFWWCWCFRRRGCWWRWFWVRVGGGLDRLGAVVGQCWVAFCVGLLLVRVSYVLVLCWGRWCCRRCLRWFRVCPLVRVLWRPVWVLVAVLVWVS